MKSEVGFKKSAQILKALGNPHRLQIISLLMEGELNVTDINKTVKMSQPALSQHLGKLRREGVLSARRDQRQIYYFIANPHTSRLLHVAIEMSEDQSRAAKPTKSATAKN